MAGMMDVHWKKDNGPSGVFVLLQLQASHVRSHSSLYDCGVSATIPAVSSARSHAGSTTGQFRPPRNLFPRSDNLQ